MSSLLTICAFTNKKKGIAMGAKCAPSVANLVLALLETHFLALHKPFFYYRFIDDIFLAIAKGFNLDFLIFD